MRRDRRLNPCDCVFHALDHHMQQRGYAGSSTFLALQIVGPLDPDQVRRALARALEAHPVMASAAAVSFWRGWPVWRHPDHPVAPHYLFEDLSGEPNWLRTAEERSQARFSLGWDRAEPPQVRLEHYRGADEQHRLVIRWPHALMDANGAQCFLAEMDRLAGDCPAPPPNSLLPDGPLHRPWTELGRLRRVKYGLLGFFNREPRLPVREASLCESLPDRPADSRRLRYLVRPWSPEQIARMQENARRIAPAGPALYSRYLAGCVLRALHRVHAEHGRRLPYYAISFVMGMRGLERRPVAGNYLTAVTLHVDPEQMDDRRAIAAALSRQLDADLARGLDRASLAIQWYTSRLRLAHYRQVLEYQTLRQPLATGYSFYGEIDPPLRRFLGAEVTNLWGCGVLSIPPGWNVNLSKFRDRINLAIAWPDAAFPERVVERYAELIGDEVFAE